MPNLKTLTSAITAAVLVSGIGIAVAQSEETPPATEPSSSTMTTPATDQSQADPNAMPAETPAQQPADACDARVVGDLEHSLRLVQVSQLFLAPVGALEHAPELEHLERLAVTTRAPLAEQDRAARVELDRDRDQQKQWGEEDDRG